MPESTLVFKDVPAVVTPVFVDPQAAEDFDRGVQDRISQRAYRLFEQSGRVPGRDAENWAEAEAEILKHALDVGEWGSWLTITASLPDVSADSIRILVRPRRVTVQPKENPEFFLVADLPSEIEPSAAVASCKRGDLKLMVKKRGAPLQKP